MVDTSHLAHIANRADYFRAKVLYVHGGVWLDIDTIVCQPLLPLYEAFMASGKELSVPISEQALHDKHICVQYIMARKQSRAIKHWIDGIEAILRTRKQFPWEALGAKMLGKAVVDNQLEDTIYPFPSERVFRYGYRNIERYYEKDDSVVEREITRLQDKKSVLVVLYGTYMYKREIPAKCFLSCLLDCATKTCIKTMKIQITNRVGYHHELIDSVLCKWQELLQPLCATSLTDVTPHFYVHLPCCKDKSVFTYLAQTYPSLHSGVIRTTDEQTERHYTVELTAYPSDFVRAPKQYVVNHPTTLYIVHRLPDHDNASLVKATNLVWLTQLAVPRGLRVFNADVLPFADTRIATAVPRFIVQGNLCSTRRQYSMLLPLLQDESIVKRYPFHIKLVGRGTLPQVLRPYRRRIMCVSNRSYIAFHQEMVSAHAMLPLVHPSTHPQYYRDQLTSSINYARAYNLVCVYDDALHRIYPLPNAQVYEAHADVETCAKTSFKAAFVRALQAFYDKSAIGYVFHKHTGATPCPRTCRVTLPTVLKKVGQSSSTITDRARLIRSVSAGTPLRVVDAREHVNEYVRQAAEAIYVSDQQDGHTLVHLPTLLRASPILVRLHYFKDPKHTCNGNFGDELSPFVMQAILDTRKYRVVHYRSSVVSSTPAVHLLGVGSYMHTATTGAYVFGTGVRTDPPREGGHRYTSLRVSAVRGPLTRAFLMKRGVHDVPEVYGDPALLLPRYYTPRIRPELRARVALVPHKSNYARYREHRIDGVHLICPTDAWTDVVDQLVSCRLVVSSSLHGLICADAYNVPNVWLNEHPLPEGDFKFRDYFASQGRPNDGVVTSVRDALQPDAPVWKQGNQLDTTKLLHAFPFA